MTEPLLFIIGVPRSGTTLLATLLEGHPDLYVDNEAIALRMIRLRRRLNDQSLKNAIASETDYDERLKRFYDSVNTDLADNNAGQRMKSALLSVAHAAGNRIYVDKSPDAIPEAERLAGLFPGSRFIHLVRDPRPTVSSLVKRQYLELHEAALLYQDWTDHALGLARWWPAQRLLRIRYEDLITDPEATLRTVCTWMGIDFQPAMLQLGEADATSGDGAYVKSTFDHAKLTAWQQTMSTAELAVVERICQPAMRELNYPAYGAPQTAARPGYWALYRNQVAHKFRLLFVGHRKQMKERRLQTIHVPLHVRLGALIKAVLRGILREELLSGTNKKKHT